MWKKAALPEAKLHSCPSWPHEKLCNTHFCTGSRLDGVYEQQVYGCLPLVRLFNDCTERSAFSAVVRQEETNSLWCWFTPDVVRLYPWPVHPRSVQEIQSCSDGIACILVTGSQPQITIITSFHIICMFIFTLFI